MAVCTDDQSSPQPLSQPSEAKQKLGIAHYMWWLHEGAHMYYQVSEMVLIVWSKLSQERVQGTDSIS